MKVKGENKHGQPQQPLPITSKKHRHPTVAHHIFPRILTCSSLPHYEMDRKKNQHYSTSNGKKISKRQVSLWLEAPGYYSKRKLMGKKLGKIARYGQGVEGEICESHTGSSLGSSDWPLKGFSK